MTTKSQDTTCCNHDCNQGRTCPVRLGTCKPVEAVHQISDPSAPDYIALAHASGAATYIPSHGARGLTFTFAQLGDFVARVQAASQQPEMTLELLQAKLREGGMLTNAQAWDKAEELLPLFKAHKGEAP